MAVHRLGAVRQPRAQRRTAHPVTASKVWPVVWQAALRAARGDTSLLRVRDRLHVRVLDNRYQPPR